MKFQIQLFQNQDTKMDGIYATYDDNQEDKYSLSYIPTTQESDYTLPVNPDYNTENKINPFKQD